MAEYKGPRYCTVCGKELIIKKYDTDEYCEWTGSKKIGFKGVCSSGHCGHNGIDPHNWVPDNTLSYYLILLFAGRRQMHCTKCNETKDL